jgi:protein gp37
VNKQQTNDKLGISWTQYTLNPLSGCTRVSPGCRHCWASDAAHGNARKGQEKYSGLTVLDSRGHQAWNGKLRYEPEVMVSALEHKIPATIFINSMSDTFHEKAEEWIEEQFDVMAVASWHTWQVLTKRPERMLAYLQSRAEQGKPVLKNALMGFSAENQDWWDKRWPYAKQVADLGWRVWTSIEPQIGPITLADAVADLSWVVIGGESTAKHEDSREFDLAWAENLIAECKAAKVPVFFKQTGVAPMYTVDGKVYPVPVSGAGKHMHEWPEHLRVQEFPVVGAVGEVA